jgi:hypothetical protein
VGLIAVSCFLLRLSIQLCEKALTGIARVTLIGQQFKIPILRLDEDQPHLAAAFRAGHLNSGLKTRTGWRRSGYLHDILFSNGRDASKDITREPGFRSRQNVRVGTGRNRPTHDFKAGHWPIDAAPEGFSAGGPSKRDVLRTLHCWGCRIFDLDPVRTPSGAITAIHRCFETIPSSPSLQACSNIPGPISPSMCSLS